MLIISQTTFLPFYSPTTLLYQFPSLLLRIDIKFMMSCDWTLKGISEIALLKQKGRIAIILNQNTIMEST